MKIKMKKILLTTLAFTVFVNTLLLISKRNAFALEKEQKKTSLLQRIKKRGYLSVVLETGYIPFEFRDKKKGLIGFDIEMIQLFAKKLGVKVKIFPVAWEGIIPSLASHDKEKFPIDMIVSGMRITKTRAKRVHFTIPYFYVGQAFVISKKDSKRIKSYKDLNQEGIVIVTQRGVEAEVICKRYFPKASLKLYNKAREATFELLGNKAHAMVYDLSYIAVLRKKYANTLKAFLTPIEKKEVGIAIRKGNPQLLKELNLFIKEFRASKEYKKLYYKYFIKMDFLKLN